MKKTYLSLLFFLLILPGCKESAPAKLEIGPHEFAREETGTFSRLGLEDIPLKIPYKQFPYESYLILFGRFDDHFVEIYDKSSGALVTTGVKQGRGPGEIVHSLFADFNPGTGTLTVVDDRGRKILAFDTDELIAGNVRFTKQELPSNWCDQIFQLDESHWLLSNMVSKTALTGPADRFTIDRTDSTRIAVYNRFPVEKDPENQNMVIYQQRRSSLSPDRTKLAIATRMRRFFFETYHIRKKEITPLSMRMIGGSVDLTQGWPEEKRTDAVTSLYAADDFVIASVVNPGSETESKTYNCIAVFDWQGNALKRIRFDGYKSIEAPCLDQDGRTLYAVAETENGYHYLVSAQIDL